MFVQVFFAKQFIVFKDTGCKSPPTKQLHVSGRSFSPVLMV